MATQATRGSYFLAEGWLLSAWGSCGRTSGFSGASHLTVCRSSGVLGFRRRGTRGGDLIYPFLFRSPFFFLPPLRGFTTWSLGGESSRRFQTLQLILLTPNSAGSTLPPPLPPQPHTSLHLCDGLMYQSAPHSLHPTGYFFKGEQVTDGSLASIGDSGRQTGSNWTSEETLLEIDRHTHAHTHTYGCLKTESHIFHSNFFFRKSCDSTTEHRHASY